MTNTKQVGSIGSYTLSFTTGDITPNDFIENFTGNNIKTTTITENHIRFVNKQGREIVVDQVGFGLDGLEHLDEELDAEEQFYPQGC